MTEHGGNRKQEQDIETIDLVSVGDNPWQC